MRVLVAEDHPELADDIAEGLRDEGFAEVPEVQVLRVSRDLIPAEQAFRHRPPPLGQAEATWWGVPEGPSQNSPPLKAYRNPPPPLGPDDGGDVALGR